jgi:hypothetical protein
LKIFSKTLDKIKKLRIFVLLSKLKHKKMETSTPLAPVKNHVFNMTQADIVAMLDSKGVKYELPEMNEGYNQIVGLRGNGVYHWFEMSPSFQARGGKTFPPMVSYIHTYSQNTGKTFKRNSQHRRTAENMLAKAMGRPYYIADGAAE